MSRIITNNLRHNDSAGDNLTLDGTGNITAPGNLSVTGTSTLTNDLIVDANTLFVDVSADRVGVNTSVPSGALTVQGGTSDSNVIRITDGSNYTMELGRSLDNTGSFGYIGGTGNTGLTLGADNTEVIRIATDGTVQLRNSPGIDFSQIQTNASGMTSETLDSYEEGTWTPVFKYYNTSSGWQNVSFDSAPNNTTASYIKIGRLVQFSYYSQGFDISTGSGLTARIVGLPFNVAGGNGNFAGAFFYHTNGFQQAISTGYVEPGTNEIVPVQAGSTSGATWDGGGTRYLMMCGIYRTT